MATDDVDKKPPKYMVPPTFTESFMRTSGSRSKQFFNGIKGWVNSQTRLATRTRPYLKMYHCCLTKFA